MSMSALYRGFAAILPALLGQGLIYLCIMGRISAAAALLAIVFMGALVLGVAAAARAAGERRLVSHRAPPAFLLRRMRSGA